MIRGVTLLAVGSACLVLGLRTGAIQVENHELGAALDARQRRLDLEWMAVLGAEARILARESVLESSQLRETAAARPARDASAEPVSESARQGPGPLAAELVRIPYEGSAP